MMHGNSNIKYKKKVQRNEENFHISVEEDADFVA
jgi:hypothetical protein